MDNNVKVKANAYVEISIGGALHPLDWQSAKDLRDQLNNIFGAPAPSYPIPRYTPQPDNPSSPDYQPWKNPNEITCGTGITSNVGGADINIRKPGYTG